MWVSRVLALLSLMACNSILGIGELRTIDDDAAIPDGPGSPDTPPAGPDDVHGTATDVFHVDGKMTVLQREDLSAATVQAYIPDDSPSGFRVVDATSKTDGTFTIPGVPAGPYLLLMIVPPDPTPRFYRTSARSLDLGRTRLGRPDVQAATRSTLVTLHLSNIDAAQLNDQFFVLSFGASTSLRVSEIPVGATTADPAIEWKTRNLPDAAKGDQLFGVHLREDLTTPDVEQTSIVDAFATSVTVVDGQAAQVTAAFQVPMPVESLRIGMDPASFVQGLDIPPHDAITLDARLRSSPYGGVSLGISTLAFTRTFRSSLNPTQDTVAYLDPFPDDIPRSVLMRAGLTWRYTAPVTHKLATYQSVAIDRTSPQFANVEAALAAPRAIKIAGVDASHAAAVPFDGIHPVPVEWAATVGVTHYSVTVMRILADGSLPAVASFETPSNAVTMPASLFQVGASYVMSVMAILDPSTDYLGGVVNRVGFPNSEREAVTARMLFAASCGNGMADAVFEDCDTGGVATAPCNTDCSTSICGDGIFNAAAGEKCDDVGDSRTCNGDCTIAACGDGKRNTVAGEDCDLGAAQNGQPGQCCSAACTLVPPATTCP